MPPPGYGQQEPGDKYRDERYDERDRHRDERYRDERYGRDDRYDRYRDERYRDDRRDRRDKYRDDRRRGERSRSRSREHDRHRDERSRDRERSGRDKNDKIDLKDWTQPPEQAPVDPTLMSLKEKMKAKEEEARREDELRNRFIFLVFHLRRSLWDYRCPFVTLFCKNFILEFS